MRIEGVVTNLRILPQGINLLQKMPISVGLLPSTLDRDRTSEFHAIADFLRESQVLGEPTIDFVNRGAAELRGQTGTATHEPSRATCQSDFSKRASQISFSIHQTSQLLANLKKCKFLSASEIVMA